MSEIAYCNAKFEMARNCVSPMGSGAPLQPCSGVAHLADKLTYVTAESATDICTAALCFVASISTLVGSKHTYFTRISVAYRSLAEDNMAGEHAGLDCFECCPKMLAMACTYSMI